MKFTFRNVGTVKKTELDLRPFTAIIGPNNSNKTYLAYLVYAVWKSVMHRLGSKQIDELIPLVRSEGDTWFVTIDKEFFERVSNFISQAAKLTANDLTNFFQNIDGLLFKKSSVELQVGPDEVAQSYNKVFEKFGDVSLGLKGYQILFRRGGVEAKMPSGKDTPNDYLKFLILDTIQQEIFGFPFVLPAERNSLIVVYKLLGSRRFKLLRDNQRALVGRPVSQRELDLLREQGDVRYPLPVEDFLDFLSDLDLQPEGEVAQNSLEFRRLASKVETKLQNKHRTKLSSTKFGGRELRIDIDKALSIELYNASSSIKQLAPLVLYLRYRAQEGDLLIIDEPEMNLHPESQAKLMEILAILVNLGVRVLITTHSPYIMAHLNNVRLAGPATTEQRAEKKRSLYLKDARAFLNPDQVMAYEMKDHKLRDLHDPDYGIRWDTLSDVSADLQQTLFKVHTPDEQAG